MVVDNDYIGKNEKKFLMSNFIDIMFFLKIFYNFASFSVGGEKKVERVQYHLHLRVLRRGSKQMLLVLILCTTLTIKCITITGQQQWQVSKWQAQDNQDSSKQTHKLTCQ